MTEDVSPIDTEKGTVNMQSFLEHRKMRIREGLSGCDFLEGIDYLIELLRLDLREAVEINAPLTEDIFRGKEVEKILKEDLEGGKSYIRGLTSLLRQYLPSAIYNEVAQATAAQGYKTAADAIGDEIDGFVQNVRTAVEKHLNMRASGGEAGEAGETGQSRSQSVPNFVPQPPHRMGGSPAAGQSQFSSYPDVEPEEGSGPNDPFGSIGSPVSGGAKAKKGPGFWQGIKNLWRNIVWNPLKKAWNTGPNESTEALVSLIRESNADILSSIDQWGKELRAFVVGKLPDIAQMGNRMTPDELAGLGSMGSLNPSPSLKPEPPASKPEMNQKSPTDTLPVDTDAGVDSASAGVDQNAMNQGLPDSEPDVDGGEAGVDEVSGKRVPVPKAKRELAALLQQEVPDFATMTAKKQSSILMRKIFDHAGLGASHISDPAKLAARISDRLSQFDTWLPKGKRQDPEVAMEPFKLIPGSWGHNRDIIVQLAHSILVQGESLPEAIQDVAGNMPSNPDSEAGSLTGSPAPTMDSPSVPKDVGNDVEVQAPKVKDDTTLPANGTSNAPEDSPSPNHTAREILNRIKKRHGASFLAHQKEMGFSDEEILQMITVELGKSNPVDVERELEEIIGANSGQEVPEETPAIKNNAPAPVPAPDAEASPFDNLERPQSSPKKSLDDLEVIHHDGGASIGRADDDDDDDDDDEFEAAPKSTSGDEEWDQIVGNPNDSEPSPEFIDDSDGLEKSPEEIERMQQDADVADEYRRKLAALSADNRASGNLGTTPSSSGKWDVGSKPTAGNVSKAAKQILSKLNQHHSGDFGDIIDQEVDRTGADPETARDSIESKVAEIIRNNWDSSYAYGAPMDAEEVLDALRHGDAGGEFDDEEDDEFDPIAHARDEEEELRHREEQVANLRSKLFAEKTAATAS